MTVENSRLTRHEPGFGTMTVLVSVVLLLTGRAVPAFSQTLSLGTTSSAAGTSFDITVGFTQNVVPVSTVQFDLGYSSTLRLISTSPGSASVSAGKAVAGSSRAGGMRVLIFGLNGNAIGPGAVAVIRFVTPSTASPGIQPITIGGIVASDAKGASVKVGGSNGSVSLTAPSDSVPPMISGVASPYVSPDSAVVAWKTGSDADSQIEFGTTAGYGSVTSLDPNRTSRHALMLTGLNAKTLYHFRVKSRGATGLLSVSSDYTFTTPAVATDLTMLYYPRTITIPTGTSPAGSGGSEYTGLAVANFDSAEAVLIFTAFDKNGTPVAGTGIKNPAARTLLPGEQLPVIDTQLFGDNLQACGYAGWIRIESSMRRVAAFFLVFNAALTVLDGSNVSTVPLPDFVLTEIEGQGYTQLSIANPNAGPVDVRLDLMKADGSVRASKSGSVKAHGVLTGDLRRDFFSGIVPSVSDYVRGSASQGVLPFERLGKVSQYTECLNGHDAAAGTTTLYVPQLAFGGRWSSSLSIVNLEGIPGVVTLKYFSNDAKQIGVSRTQTIGPYGKILIGGPDFFMASAGGMLLEGYVEAVSDGVRLTGSVVFGDPGRKQFSSALPLVSKPQKAALFSHVASDETYFTGLAILNPGSADAVVTIDLYSQNGILDASVTQTIPARQRKSRLLTELFPVLLGQSRISGYFRVTSSQPVASFAIVGTNDLSVLAAVPPQETPQ